MFVDTKIGSAANVNDVLVQELHKLAVKKIKKGKSMAALKIKFEMQI